MCNNTIICLRRGCEGIVCPCFPCDECGYVYNPYNHFFGIDKKHHKLMIEQLKTLKEENDKKKIKKTLTNDNELVIPESLKEHIKELEKKFKNLQGTGKKYNNIKTDINNPCCLHWPRLCDYMVNKNIQFYHNNKISLENIDYIKVKNNDEIIYANSTMPIDVILIIK